MTINLLFFIIAFLIVFGGISFSALYAIHALKDIPENKTKKSH